MKLLRRAIALTLFLCMGTFAFAQEYITTQGRLSDPDFYRLISCGAPPGGDCNKPIVRWSSRDARRLTVGITRIDPAFPASRIPQIEAAVSSAIQQLNNSGADIKLRPSANRPKIPILLLDIPEGGTLHGTGISGLDGIEIEAARVQI
ncbi:hypothetical protein [Shimia abyssi]|uniref:Uncharacterized protein n=1 Tax=Shimia abyssi TaxID=1662395 RepID=A0A2P8FD15_9RHOB|nr:hypothetical protein [Shimia abyssi]PSL19610.1 hypothetical protein CLV88_10532 [Shimia abyssi]